MASEGNNCSLARIITAINEGKEDVLRELCSNEDDVNLCFKSGSKEITPLALAAKLGRTEIAKILLEKSADVNSQDGYGRTALFLACEANVTPLVELLLKRGADPNLKPHTLELSNETPLLCSIKKKNKQIVQALLVTGASVTECVSYMAALCSYIHVATWVKEPDIIKTLVENGCSLNWPNDSGDIPLALAVRQNDLMLTNTLLELGACPNIPQSWLGSVLHAAAGRIMTPSTTQHNVAMVSTLVEHGAQVNMTDSQGRTPLTLNVALIILGREHDTAKFLIKHGTILNEPVLSARLEQNLEESGEFELLELFIKGGFNAHSVSWLMKYVNLTEIVENDHATLGHDMEKFQDFTSYLYSYYKEPRPLSRICCFLIRNCVISATDGKYVHRQIQRLPLPEPLIDLLSLEEL